MSRRHSHVEIDPDNIRPAGVCDRCGQRWNLDRLRPQYRYAGHSLVDTGMLVCPVCYDEDNPQNHTLTLPIDPETVLNARPANSIYIDAASSWTLLPHVGTEMFRGISHLVAELHRGHNIVADVSDTSAVDCDLLQGFGFADVEVSGTSGVIAALKFGALLGPVLSDVSSVTAALKYTAQMSPAFNCPGNMGASPLYTAQIAPTLSDVSGVVAALKYTAQMVPVLSDVSAVVAALKYTAQMSPAFIGTSNVTVALTRTAVITSIVQQASATSTESATLSAPADIIAGDVLVFLDAVWNLSGGPPASSVPSGFTSIATATTGLGSDIRTTLSYKLAVGTEGSSTITGMSSTGGASKILVVFRPDDPASTLTVFSVAAEATNANPSAQTVTASGGTPPLIVVGAYTSSGAIDPRGFSTTKDDEIESAASAFDMWIAWKIYNTSPADTSIDMDDEGASNILESCYITVS